MHGSSSHYRLHISSHVEEGTGPLIIQDQFETGDFRQYRNAKLVTQASKTVTSKSNARFIIGNRHFVYSGVSPQQLVIGMEMF